MNDITGVNMGHGYLESEINVLTSIVLSLQLLLYNLLIDQELSSIQTFLRTYKYNIKKHRYMKDLKIGNKKGGGGE